MESPDPTHDLLEVQKLCRQGQCVITLNAARTAEELGFDEVDVRECVLGLGSPDFDKSMESTQKSGRWQDVYKPTYCGKRLYVKLDLDEEAGQAWVVSFHV